MKKLKVFALTKHAGPYDSWPQHSELVKGGVSTGKNIPGYVIEAQYEYQHGFLLVTSWDCSFEEAQTFILLSHELDLVYEETLGVAYASVWMEGHEPINECSVIFHCNGDLDILATVESSHKLKLETLSRVHRKKAAH